MSAIVSNDANNTFGSIKMRYVNAKEKNYYCLRWTVKGEIIQEKGKVLNSPIFTIPHKDKCKWYFSFQSKGDGEDKGAIFFPMRLVLDRSSDCKAAVAEFQGSVLEWEGRPRCVYEWPSDRNRRLESSKTFKFDKTSENSAIILCVGRQRYFGYFDGVDEPELRFECDIMIERTFPQDNSFPNDFGSLLKNQQFTDVVLSAGEKKFPAHKLILTARSSVFAAMFAPNATENQDVVHIEDTDEDVVEEMIRYIYTGEVEKLDRLAKPLLIVADKYDLKGLRSKCEEILIESLSSSNAFDLLLFADLHNADDLKSEIIYLVAVRDTQLMETSFWKNLKEAHPELFRELSSEVRRLQP